MTSHLIAMGLLGLFLGGGAILVQITRGRIFSMLTFTAGLFLLESAGGAIEATMPNAFIDYDLVDRTPLLLSSQALALYLIGFSIFLYGYAVTAWVLRLAKSDRHVHTRYFFRNVWTPSYRLLLAIGSLVALGAGFVQHYPRIRNAGGFAEFFEVAYRHRFGTGTEGGSSETALVVVANLLSISAVAFGIMWLIAWVHGKLTPIGKIGVVIFLLLLIFRQWLTLFRSPLIFTALSLFAALGAERKRSAKALIVTVLILAVVFVGVNFVHLYAYFLTAGWDKPSLTYSLQMFVAPHGHMYTIAAILDTKAEGVEFLKGDGLMESVLFFVPRSVWPEKLPSGEYGTLRVQKWAGLPTHFHMAITHVGEMFAHFGYIGLAMMVVYGALYGVFDWFADRGPELRAALFGILLARVLADTGMGLLAVSITVVSALLFLGQAVLLRGLSAFIDSVLQRSRRLLGLRPRLRPT